MRPNENTFKVCNCHFYRYALIRVTKYLGTNNKQKRKTRSTLEPKNFYLLLLERLVVGLKVSCNICEQFHPKTIQRK